MSSPPEPTGDLKAGILTKQSDFLKAWRERHFIVQNKSENFRINFFAGEGGKQTGHMDLCGYEVVAVSDREFGINLVPSNDKRKTWFLKCHSADEFDEWMDLFNMVCAVVGPPISKDPVIQAAFIHAYHETRCHYGYYNNAALEGSEVDLLTDLLVEVLERDVLSEVYEKGIPIIVKAAKTHVNKLVNVSVSAAWKSALEACNPAKSAIETTVKPVLAKYFEHEKEIQGNIEEKIADKINPFIEENSGKVFGPAAECVTAPIAKALASTIKELDTVLRAFIVTEEFKTEAVRKVKLDELAASILIWEGPLNGAKNMVDECVKNTFTKIASLISKSLSLRGIGDKIMKKNCQLASYAVFTFAQSLDKTEYSIAVDDLLTKMIHDAAIYLKELVNDILSAMIADKIAETITPPCATAVAPIQETIDAIPGGLNDFMDLTALTEDSINNLIDGGIESASGPSVTSASSCISELKK